MFRGFGGDVLIEDFLTSLPGGTFMAVLLAMGLDPVWLAINLRTSFLTPPFGFSLFYLRSVAPASINTAEIYRGALPFVLIQLGLLLLLSLWPALAT